MADTSGIELEPQVPCAIGVLPLRTASRKAVNCW